MKEDLARLVISLRAGLRQERRIKGVRTSGTWVGLGRGTGHCEDEEQGQVVGTRGWGEGGWEKKNER